MQRQSLGSPTSKLHKHGALKQEILIADDEPPRHRDSCVLASSHVDYDVDGKAPKSHRLFTPPPHRLPNPESFIHLIPVLTLFCFLILYLCSHCPSQADLTHFSGFKHLISCDIDVAVASTNNDNTMASKVDSVVFAIRNLRSLQGTRGANHFVKSKKSMLNRKLAHF